MDTLKAYIERISRETVAQSACLEYPDPNSLTGFLENPGPSALFIVQSENDTLVVRSTLDAPTVVLALIRQAPLNLEEPLSKQIFPITIPNGGDVSEGLHAVVHYVIAPYFEANATAGVATASANITAARQKIAELELSFYNLQFHTEIQLLDLAPPASSGADDLNALQNTVNEWKKSIRSVVRVSRDPAVGTASEEVLFWHSMENALLHIEEQLKEPKVTETIKTLEEGKRFHATVSFPGDTGLPDALAEVQKYNIVLRDLPLNDLITANDFYGISQAIEAIFGHITKKLRPSAYPVWRALALVEAISADFARTVKENFSKLSVFSLDSQAFSAIINQVRALFNQWDDHVREFTNIARDVIRKRAEKFIPVRINGKHLKLKQRIEYLGDFKLRHDQLITSLATVPDLQLIPKLRAEYLRIAAIDVLDTSPEGVGRWDALEASYNTAASSIEAEVAKLLRSRLSGATSSNEMFRIFGDFNALFTRPAIRGAIHEYQSRLLEVVKSDIQELQARVKKQYTQSFAFKSASLYDVPSISGLVIWLRQIRSRLDRLLERVNNVLGADWRNYADGEKLYAECTAFFAKIDTQPVVDNWINSIATKQLVANEPIFTVRRAQVSINFDGESGTLFKEMRALSSFGVHVPHTFITNAQNSKQLYPFAVRLIEDLKIFHECLGTVEGDSTAKALVQKELNAVCSLMIEGANSTWKTLSLVDDQSSFVKSFDHAVLNLEKRVEQTMSTTRTIDACLLELVDCEYDRAIFDAIITKIDMLVENVVTGSQSEFGKKTLGVVAEYLAARCIKELDDWSVQEKLYYHNLTLANQVIVTSPPLEKSREALFGELNAIVSQISLVTDIPSSVWTAVSRAIAQIDEIFASAQEYLGTWYGFQGLWDLKSDKVWSTLGRSLNDWQQVLVDLHESRKALDDDSQRQVFGRRLAVNFSQIHAYVNSKYDIWQNDMIQKFSTLVAERSGEILGTIRNSRQDHEEISFLTGSAELLVRYLETTSSTAEKLGDFESQIRALESSQAALSRYRFQFPKRWIYNDQINSEWRSLYEIHRTRAAELERLKPRLIAELESNIARLVHKVETLHTQWQSSKPVSGSIKPEDALFAVARFDEDVKKAIKQRDIFGRCCILLAVEFNFAPPLDGMADEIADFVSAWNAINKTWESLRTLESTPWNTVSSRKVRSALSQLLDQTKEVPSRVRQYVAFQHVQNIIRERIQSSSTLSALLSNAVKQRHWDKITQALDRPTTLNLNSLQLGDVWALGLQENKLVIDEHVKHAEGESRIETSINEINAFWASFTVELVSYQDKVRLIKNWDEIFSKADEHLQSLEAMKNSVYFKVFSQIALEWETKLNKLRALFDNWVDVQRQWVYLEGVFSTADVRHVLRLESAKFGTINSELFAIFKMVAKNPNALEISSIPGIQESMTRTGELLFKLQRALSEYFERERKQFGRYYFVGDDDVLEMIGTFRVERVEKHLKKMFAGVSRFIFQEDPQNGSTPSLILGVVSGEGEELKFTEPVNASASVISVLQQVETQIDVSLRNEVKNALEALEILFGGETTDLLEWAKRPSQACLVALRIYWTQECETESKRSGLKAKIQQALNFFAAETLTELSVLNRRHVEILITELVHLKTTTELKNLNWDMQLRYYFQKSSTDVIVRQAGAEFRYGFEYQGAPALLVNTPLVERMFLTMTQALDQRFGGSPFGPAGTGKTESVKALGQALGMFVVVFCCDETFDFKAITRLLAGICQTGAWACFDEFNRLESNTLSSVSTHVATIEQALKTGCTNVAFGDREGELNGQTALFVTMNPDYIGRHQLPDNMKNLFRSFAMRHPDKERIVEVILYTQGFEHSAALSENLVPLFNELASRCSPQMHYDWGLRAIKGVLRICGNVKRQLGITGVRGEMGVIKLACNEIITPKLVKDDVEIYRQVEEVFADADELTLPLPDLNIDALDLIPTPDWIAKVKQLHQFLEIHHSVMLVGATATGKSSSWKTLASLLEVEIYQINPKTVSKDHLYGKLDVTTREWTDGFFTATLRKITENLRGEDRKMHWIVFDGEVDPDWAENLNSVLDDNKILTLPSGERIPLPPNVRIIFEVSSLATATPATVSRCTMIWFDQDLLSIGSLMKHMSDTFSQHFDDQQHLETARLVIPLIERIDFEEVHIFAANELRHIMPYSFARVLGTFRSLVESAVPLYSGSVEYLEKVVYSAIIWAFAGGCDTASRIKFCKWFESISGYEDIMNSDVSPISGQWIPWQDTLGAVELEPQDVVDSNLVIPTIDTVRHEALVYRLLAVHQPVILCGPPGAGKTMTLLSSLRRSEAFDLVTLNFSKTTSPDMIIRALEQKCNYKNTPNGLVMEPGHMGQWVVLFCDEINLPAQDQYGTQKVIALLREIVQRQGFYKGTRWVRTRRIQFVGACNPPTDVGRIPLDNRFLRLCTLVYVDHPAEESLHQIYKTICGGLLKCVPELRNNADLLSAAMIQVYQKSQAKLQGVMAHYVYSPRELTRWTKGIYAAIKDKFEMSLDDLVRVWAHEGLRLFSDRLATQEQRDWTFELFKSVSTSFHASELALQQPILFSDWITKEYTSVNRQELVEFLSVRMRVFNEEVMDKKLTLFDDMVEHILRIDRILRQPQGHMILMGLSSSGKTTLTKFVCWMNGISTYQIQSSSNYSEQDFVSDLRAVLKRAGCAGLKTCFILDESNLWDSSFLEKMNTLLANSEVPGLFENEEYTSLITDCRRQSTKQGLNLVDETDLMAWFTSQITQNLHVVFTINSPDNAIVSHTATSPALFNRCVLSWMGDWSLKAMVQVGTDQISTVDTGTIAKDVLAELFVSLHKTIENRNSRTRIVTPGEFLAFIHQFVRIYTLKRDNLEEEQRHCNVGVEKLKGTMLEVKTLRSELADKQTELERKDKESRQMLQQMLSDQSEAERKKEAGINIRMAVEAQNIEIESRKEIVYRDLALAQPAVEEAQKGVKDIKKQHLNELRAFTNPPEAVKTTLEAVCFVFGLKHGTWREVLQAVRGEDFIPSIVEFSNEEQMTPQVLQVLQNDYMKRPNFTFAAVDRASKACGPLQKWITAQVAYATVLQNVEPLNQEVIMLERVAEEKRAQEAAINEMLEELENSIEDYKVRYAQLIADTQSIKAEIQSVQSKLDSSVQLVSSLETEKVRWIESVAGFAGKTEKLVGDCLLGSAFLVYCGYFDQKVRGEILEEWQFQLDHQGVAHTDNLDVVGFMSTSAQRLLWQSYSMDTLMMENAIMLNEYIKFPFIIDPTHKIQKYLQKEEKVAVTSFMDSSFKKHVESALRFGTSVLIRNAENFDPVIMPLLNQEYSKRGGRLVVDFDGREVDVGKDYKLFLVTNDAEIQLAPHISSRTTVVNFSITRNSLERIALDGVLQKNKPELETKRRELLNLQGEYQVQLHQLEVQLLSALNETDGNILDNTELVTTLETIKLQANETKAKSLNAKQAMIEIEAATAEYMPIAVYCGQLQTLVAHLASVLSCYQFSLENFLELFHELLGRTEFESVVSFSRKLFAQVFNTYSPALLQNDRVSFAMSLLALFEGKYDALSFDGNFSELNARFTTTIFESEVDLRAEDDWFQLIRESKVTLFMVKDMDPTVRLRTVATRAEQQCRVIALGSHEGEQSAEAAIHTAVRTGQWLIIQNLHMAPHWMGSLLGELQKAKVSAENCRIIMTMQLDNPNVPASILKLARLVTVERPRGLKAGLRENLSMIYPRLRDPPAERAMIFVALAWTHAVIQERQRLGVVGWNNFYDFNDFDLTFALDILSKQLEPFKSRSNVDPEVIRWDYMCDLIVETVYGAKIYDRGDYHTVTGLFKHMFSARLFELKFELSEGHPETATPEVLDDATLNNWLGALPDQEPPTWLGLELSDQGTYLKQIAEQIRDNAEILVSKTG